MGIYYYRLQYYKDYDSIAMRDNDYEAAEYTYFDSVGAVFDMSEFKYIVPKDALPIKKWMCDPCNIRPYSIGGGEVAFYQLILELNDVAKAFLILDDFINETNFYTLLS